MVNMRERVGTPEYSNDMDGLLARIKPGDSVKIGIKTKQHGEHTVRSLTHPRSFGNYVGGSVGRGPSPRSSMSP